MNMNEAKDAIYTSLDNDNADINTHIANLRAVMKQDGVTEAVFDPTRLAQNNRQGRKTMMAYFKKQGVKIRFEGAE